MTGTHSHTRWKTFIHSCGSIWRLLDDIVDAGFDALIRPRPRPPGWTPPR